MPLMVGSPETSVPIEEATDVVDDQATPEETGPSEEKQTETTSSSWKNGVDNRVRRFVARNKRRKRKK